MIAFYTLRLSGGRVMAIGRVQKVPTPTSAEVRAYILDMIIELAKMSRDSGEQGIAIHLEAIVAASTSPSRR